MVLLETPVKEENFGAIDFSLKGVDGKTYTFEDVRGENGTVIAFICNHCPYVKAIIHRFVDDMKALEAKGVKCVAIMPNDAERYPDDSFEKMQDFAREHDFNFPYLIDETQETAKAYGAVCTPDLYGFDGQGILQYRGRLDSAGPNEADNATVKELVNAMREIAGAKPVSAQQFPSMGCSIKWKE